MKTIDSKEGNALIIVMLVFFVSAILLFAASSVSLRNNNNSNKVSEQSETIIHAKAAINRSASYMSKSILGLSKESRAYYKENIEEFVTIYDGLLKDYFNSDAVKAINDEEGVKIDIMVKYDSDNNTPIIVSQATYGETSRVVSAGVRDIQNILGSVGEGYMFTDAIVVDTLLVLGGARITGDVLVLNPIEGAIQPANKGGSVNGHLTTGGSEEYEKDGFDHYSRFDFSQIKGTDEKLLKQWFVNKNGVMVPNEENYTPYTDKTMPSASLREFPNITDKAPVTELEMQRDGIRYEVIDQNGNLDFTQKGPFNEIATGILVLPNDVYIPKFRVDNLSYKRLILTPKTGNVLNILVDEISITGLLTAPEGVQVNFFVNKPKGSVTNVNINPIELISGSGQNNKMINFSFDTVQDVPVYIQSVTHSNPVSATFIGEFLNVRIGKSSNVNIVAFGEGSNVEITHSSAAFSSTLLFVPKGRITFNYSHRGSLVAKEVVIMNSRPTVIWDEFDTSDLPVHIDDPSGVTQPGSGGSLSDPQVDLLIGLRIQEVKKYE